MRFKIEECDDDAFLASLDPDAMAAARATVMAPTSARPRVEHAPSHLTQLQNSHQNQLQVYEQQQRQERQQRAVGEASTEHRQEDIETGKAAQADDDLLGSIDDGNNAAAGGALAARVADDVIEILDSDDDERNDSAAVGADHRHPHARSVCCPQSMFTSATAATTPSRLGGQRLLGAGASCETVAEASRGAVPGPVDIAAKRGPTQDYPDFPIFAKRQRTHGDSVGGARGGGGGGSRASGSGDGSDGGGGGSGWPAAAATAHQGDAWLPQANNIISPELRCNLEAFLLHGVRDWESIGRRKRKHYGFRLDNSYTKLTRIEAIPSVLVAAARACHAAFPDALRGVHVESWNQCIVNMYRSNEGIGRHVDAKSYGARVMTFALLGDPNEPFCVVRSGQHIRINTPDNSAYLLCGGARWMPHERASKYRARPLFTVTFRCVE